MTFYGMLHNLAKSFPEERKVLDQWVFVLDQWVFGLRFWVFVLDTSQMRCQCFYSAVMANSKLDYLKNYVDFVNFK